MNNKVGVAVVPSTVLCQCAGSLSALAFFRLVRTPPVADLLLEPCGEGNPGKLHSSLVSPPSLYLRRFGSQRGVEEGGRGGEGTL